MRKQNFIQGTVILIVTLTIVKILGLINRFVIARLLTTEGIGIYMLVMPTFILLISLSQLGFPISISKLVSENNIKKTLTNKSIILSALKLATINSVILITLLLVSVRFLSYHLLHDERTFYPLMGLAFFIPLVAFSSILKGYLHGLKVISIASYSQLVEQIVRIIVSIGLVVLLLPYGLEYAVTGTVISISIGELAAIIYMLIRILNRHKIGYILKPDQNSINPTKEILSISIPATGSRLIGSLSHFFEPIIFASAMIGIGVSSKYTTILYGQISGYVISVLVVPSFIVVAISTPLLPLITEHFTKNNMKKIHYYFNMSIFLSFVMSTLFIIILILFPSQLMKLFFDTTEGSNFLYYMAPFFIIYYFELPISQTLHAIDKAKEVMITTLFCNSLKLFLIYILVSYSKYHVAGLPIAIVINIVLITLINFIILKKAIKLKLNYYTISMSILLLLTTLAFGYIIKNLLSIHYLLIIVLVVLFYLTILFIFNIGNVKSIKKEIKLSLRKSSQ